MAVEQPSGTVTLVFTDIEGSTRLLERLGVAAYRDALAEHRRIVRDACIRHQGYEVDYEGDAFFYAFSEAESAVRAADTATAALEPGPIRIRVGMHTGEPGLDPPKYVGLDVHRAARIMATAHGGQIVMSRTTAEQLGNAYPLTDLGDHHLKDISLPERIFQLGTTSHPPLRSLFRSTLPVPPTSLLGRDAELEVVTGLLRRAETRVLTLTGPGGSGKTRLAVEAAGRVRDAFADGTFWIPLAPVRDPAFVLPTLAQALAVREAPGEALHEIVVAALRDTRALLVLDNAEHLLSVVAEEVASLIARCPALRVLVTSRERLRIGGETTWAVPTLAPGDAVRLLVERARAAGVELAEDEAGAALCRQLDNLPLAIELAAARSPLFTPTELQVRLEERLDVLAGNRDSDGRQQTLQATLDWSYDLLEPEEQRAYRFAGVLAGDVTLAVIEEVCGAGPDTLQSLVEKHLVRRRIDGPTARFSMLETVRRHAAGKLSEDETREALGRAFAFMCAEIASYENKAIYSTADDWAPSFRADESTILGLVSLGHRTGQLDAALELAVAASRLWYELGSIRTAGSILGGLIDSPLIGDSQLRARGLRAMARADAKRGAWDEAIRRATEALALHDEIGDRAGAGVAAGTLGAIYGESGDTDSARGYLERSLALAEEAGDDGEIGRASYNLGMLISDVDASYTRALALFEQGYAAQSRVGHTPGMLMGLHVIGEARCESGDLAGGLDALASCLELALTTHHDVYVPELLEGLAQAAVALERWPEAATFVASADALRSLEGLVGATKNADSQQSLRDTITAKTPPATPLDPTDCLAVGRALALDARGATDNASGTFVR